MSIVLRLLAPVLLVALALGGCASSGDEATQAQHKLASLSDVPLPRGYSLDSKETIVFGEGDRWTGKVVYDINSSGDDMFEYLRREMPNFGWSEVSVFRANVPVMTYQRQGRVATVQIHRGRLYGSTVEIVVAPMTQGGRTGALPGSSGGGLRADEQATPPPPPAAPPRAVSVQPLK